MPKTYTAENMGHAAAWLADNIPHQLDQRGGKMMLNTQQGSGTEVRGAGNGSAIDFTIKSFIYTHGLLQCMALCAVWNKVDMVFRNGYLAHVSRMEEPQAKPRSRFLAGARSADVPQPDTTPFIQTAMQAIPPGAWIVADVGTGVRAWGPLLTEKLISLGHADDHIWIYYRPADGGVGFGIDKHGRFGET